MNLGRHALAIMALLLPVGARAVPTLRCDGLSANTQGLRVEVECEDPGSVSRSLPARGCALVFIDLPPEGPREAFRLPVRAIPPTPTYRAFVSDEHDVDLALFPRDRPFSLDRDREWLEARREARLTAFYQDIFLIASMGCEILEAGR